MKIKGILVTVFSLLISYTAGAKSIETLSPDKNIKLNVTVGIDVSIQVYSGVELLFEVKDIHLDTDQGFVPERNPKVRSVIRSNADRTVYPKIKEKFSKIPEKYNETLITFSNKSKLQFRVYNEGVVYRFITDLKGDVIVNNEHAEFIFDKSSILTFQEDSSVNSDYEAPYVVKNINSLENGKTGNLPALLQTPSSMNVLFLESGTIDYPCMWLVKGNENLEAHFWNHPKIYNSIKGNSKNRRAILECENYIAKTKGTRDFPWRIFAISKHETELLANQLVYLLAPECKLDDTSWIKPGWVTFDWWARRGLYNVDFKAGINTETAKYMIDFAADFGIRYFLFDDGWTYKEDLTKTIDGLDMPEVVKYATSKNIDVLLWVTYDLFDSQMETALQQFEKWGIKGLKIDFINRSDQEAVNFYWRAAEQTAKYKMVLNFHGAYRPDGLRRAYPNVLTREALIEFEQNGGTYKDNPDHHCTLPFIRNVAGPMDYIPGTMNNATKKNFRFNHDTPMGQGTRAHSVALAVITESPMQMLPDPQTDYYREEECTRFLTQIPVEWDETVPLKGKVGDYVALARRNGNVWYTAAITDWIPRTMELSFDFLDEGKEYTMEIIKDGINADIRAIDYKREIRKVKKGEKINIQLASGGGWITKIY